jgi:hypothetical protein
MKYCRAERIVLRKEGREGERNASLLSQLRVITHNNLDDETELVDRVVGLITLPLALDAHVSYQNDEAFV